MTAGRSGDRGGRDGEGRLDMPFVGIPSFLRSPVIADLEALDADVAVVGVPTDEGSPLCPDHGSDLARSASIRCVHGWRPRLLRPAARASFPGTRDGGALIADVGDADVLPTNVEGTFAGVTETMRKVLVRGAIPVVLGGDHAVTLPVVRAFEGPLHVIHFDAHLDYMAFIHCLEYTNAHAFRNISRMDHVASLTQAASGVSATPK